MPTLFDPLRIGDLEVPNRIFMSPLTRGRGTVEALATPLMATYYAQRASAGLIISEATGISRLGLGWPYAPGLWTQAQAQSWKPVTTAVHDAGGRMFAQLWHMGRLVHPDLGGAQPVSASDGAAPGEASVYGGKLPYVAARALRLEEIPGVVSDYRQAARHAMAAGFDGVQIHAANGYLIDQFLRDSSNRRTDEYGGSIANRIRLLKEVTQAVIAEVGAGRTAVRLSPNGVVGGVEDSQPDALFSAAAATLSDLSIAFLDIREGSYSGDGGASTPAVRAAFKGPLTLNGGYDPIKAAARVASGVADGITFGKSFLANPDLPRRVAQGSPLNPFDAPTFYTQGPLGYTDYPALDGA